MFGLLGFLLGGQGGHNKCPMMDMPHGMYIKRIQGMKKGANVFMFKSDEMMEREGGFEIINYIFLKLIKPF